MIKDKNELGQDSFFALTTATFQHASVKIKRLYQNPADAYYNLFSAAEIRLDCIPEDLLAYSTFWDKPPPVISLYRP